MAPGGRLAAASLAVAAVVATGCALPAPADADPAADTAARLTPAQLAGQLVAFGVPGTSVPPALRARIRRGEVGAVILFGRNVPSLAATRRLVARLQAIRRPAGLRAPLLVMVDQEGGQVRRLPGPPARSAAELSRSGPRAGLAAGRAAGRLLRGVGANVDLAPVAGVARRGSFLAAFGRSFGARPAHVARMTVAFAAGLRASGVAATAKHFPGLGSATRNTDDRPVTVPLSRATLRSVDERPFAALVAHRVPLVMMASATYPALDPARPAVLSSAVVGGELRGRLGFGGVVMTDALDTPALAPFGGTAAIAVRAAGAGNDLLIYSGGGAVAGRAAGALTAAIRSGELPRRRARESVTRLLRLRAGRRLGAA